MTIAKLLLVEDNDADAELITETFECHKIHADITRARDGVEALEMLRGEGDWQGDAPRPDLLLLDLNLPRMDGRELLAVMKADPALRSIPVVILTSSSAEADVVASYDNFAASYVTKPVGLAGLERIVQAFDQFWLSVVRLPL